MKTKFLEFVDASRALNRRRVGSSSPEYYFDAMFSRSVPPDKKDQTYERKVRRSVGAASTWHKRPTTFQLLGTHLRGMAEKGAPEDCHIVTCTKSTKRRSAEPKQQQIEWWNQGMQLCSSRKTSERAICSF